MSNTLAPTRPLDGFDQTWGMTRLYEAPAMSLLSLAMPLNKEKPFTDFLKSQWKLTLPAVGQVRSNNNISLLRLAQDQCFLQLPPLENPLSIDLQNAATGNAYLTDQSDAWTSIILEGPGALPALERLCMIDLHPTVFLVDQIARTMMEHLNVIIWRQDHQRYCLLSARSSAKSFLHALTTSLDYTRSH